jgi:AraC-like DNA-binding protein
MATSKSVKPTQARPVSRRMARSAAMSESAVSLPAPQLRPFITRYAGFRHSGLPPGVHIGHPSTEVDLIISLGPRVDVLQMPNSTQRPASFAALVSGMQDAPALVRQGSEVFGIHVFIKPLGVRAILGVESAAITSLVVELSDIWGRAGDELIERLDAAETWPQRFGILNRAFLSMFTRAAVESEISWAWNRLVRTHGTVPVHVLADEIGYSRRHFGERFRRAVGVAPKIAARIMRFERACRLITEPRGGGLAHVAAACGYYDQAHLTRDWHAFTGCSPKEWIARELPFLQDYELGGRDNDVHEAEPRHQSDVRRPV